jgi:DNA-binding transcriptional MerR regulator
VDIESAATPDIPDKLYFRIGEVSKLLDVEPYVVRFWETEFPGLTPKKSDTGQRLFRRKDVELLLRIKHLLYEKKFTIEGARQALAKTPKDSPLRQEVVQQSLFAPDPLPAIREELRSLLELLK